ncbi:MAG: ECF transporter S component [Ruminococcus sp.]|nr:ECF transporter S component [Ruminococcus sp.]
MIKTSKTKSVVLLGLLSAVVMVFSFTPIGSIPIGPLVISLNVIPVAIAAVALGPVGGAVIGGVFGLFSFLQCFGIGIPSAMGAALLEINPFLCFVQRFFPRLIDGLLVGFIFRLIARPKNVYITSGIAGLLTAFFNTAFFMYTLVFLFGKTEYMQEKINGQSIIGFIVAFVGVNAVTEMIAATIVTAAVSFALYKAKLIQIPSDNELKS